MTILTASTLSGADVLPIGGSITGATKSIGVDEALHQTDRMAILNLPIRRQAATPPRQQMAGQVFDLDPGQDEKAGLTAEQRQPSLTPLAIPADELIPRGALPSRSAKHAPSQHSPVLIPNQILEVFSHRAGIGQVMMLMQQLAKRVTVPYILTNLLDSQRLQLAQLLGDGLRSNCLSGLGRQAHPVWTTSPSGRQLDEAALLQLQEQTPSRHILEQPRFIAPLPLEG
jgi:hypothetical protein